MQIIRFQVGNQKKKKDINAITVASYTIVILHQINVNDSNMLFEFHKVKHYYKTEVS